MTILYALPVLLVTMLTTTMSPLHLYMTLLYSYSLHMTFKKYHYAPVSQAN